MKLSMASSILAVLLIVNGCKKSESPVAPAPVRTMHVAAYGFSIDSSYYKVWSDSSWEKFNQVTTVNNVVYATVLTSTGDEQYYSMAGYAGIKPSGQMLIIFDSPIGSLSDTLEFGRVYTQQATFSYQGFGFTLSVEQSLRDTVGVTVAFGHFNPCLWFDVKTTMSGAGQTQTQTQQVWIAAGPSSIKQMANSGVITEMVRGRVNGQGWGMPFAKRSFPPRQQGVQALMDALVMPLFRPPAVASPINGTH